MLNKEGMVFRMLKKLASLLLALLLCVSLLPGKARAENTPDPADPPAVVEPEEPETPGVSLPHDAPGVPDGAGTNHP